MIDRVQGKLRLALFSAVTILPIMAQPERLPHGHLPHVLYNGGNQIIFEGDLKASSVYGSIVDEWGDALPTAVVQIERYGSDHIVRETVSNKSGKFRLPSLQPGEYWLGISKGGFNLHYWYLIIEQSRGDRKLKVTLSIGN
jgi:hypothetical protein